MEGFGAHRIIDDVDAVPLGEVANFFREIVLVISQGMGAAIIFGARGFFWCAHRADHPRPGGPGGLA